FHSDWRPTIKARSINLDNFARKKPADRQRLEPSLGEPLLLTLYRNAILGGKVVERWKRDDVIGIGEQPTWKVAGKKLMKGFASFFGCDS
ncbi:MAG: hypothetical protein JSV50_17025, partial [Desulfobacteraceae bacterium]